MQQGVSTIQRMSQKRLKGRPSTIGWTRSQSATEKQMAAKGMSPSARAPMDGLFTCTRRFLECGSVLATRDRLDAVIEHIGVFAGSYTDRHARCSGRWIVSGVRSRD
jgi:hypothetical protein